MKNKTTKIKMFISVGMWIATLGLYSQNITVNGNIKDINKEPIIGATIVVQGNESHGTITDLDGNFTLQNVDPTDVLHITYVGMEDKVINVNGRTTLDIVMLEDVTTIDEVVVVGFATQKKVNLTGSVSVVNSEDLESRPVVNVSQALQGLAPGLNITQSGTLGGSLENRPSINIRGVGTIGEGSSASPLILIDGIEGDINSLNPQDIDNISVLKDAAASSIYGSRAPFGVILITTKQGKSGKTTISVNSNFRVNEPTLIPEMMDSYTFALYFNDAGINSGQTPFFTDERIARIKDYMDGKITTTIIPRSTDSSIWADGYMEGNDNVDWYKALYQSKTVSQNYSVDVSGGNESVKYYISGDYLNQPGFMKFGKDQYDRYNTNINLDAKLLEWLSINYISRFTREEFQRPSYMNNTFYNDIVRQGWPMLPLYDNNGQLYDSPSPALSLRDGGKSKRQTDRLIQQISLTATPMENWTIFGNFAYSKTDYFYHWELQKTYNYNINNEPYPAKTVSKVNEEAFRENYFNLNLYSQYLKSVGKNNFTFMAGIQLEETGNRFLMGEREGIIVPNIPLLDATSGTDYNGKTVPPKVSGRNNDWSTIGYFGRLNYNFEERYLLEFNLRYDGSSRFRKERRWVLSPSLSAGWNISRESFWSNIEEYINMFKVRGSYGELGNQNTDNWYPTYLIMPIGISNGTWLVNGASPNTSSAPGIISTSLTWEKIRNWNFGLDLAFLNNRLGITFDYFNRFTDDMIGPAPEMPVILGTSVPRTNNTNLKTFGSELNISWRDRVNNSLSYNVNLLLADSRTKITKYPNPTNSLDRYREGQLMGEIWGYETIGIAKTDEEMEEHLATLPEGGQNALGSNWEAGDIMFKDLNGDGLIDDGSRTIDDHGDLKIIGNSTPRYSFGLDLGLNWKGFDTRVFFQGILKKDVFSMTPAFWGVRDGIWNSTGLKPHIDYFRDDETHPLGLNTDSYYPRPLFASGKNQWIQSRYLQDASYIRLKNIQIGYTLSTENRNILKGIDKMRVFISGENLFTLTRVGKMFDPETIDGGVYGNVYPLYKTYSVGINITL